MAVSLPGWGWLASLVDLLADRHGWPPHPIKPQRRPRGDAEEAQKKLRRAHRRYPEEAQKAGQFAQPWTAEGDRGQPWAAVGGRGRTWPAMRSLEGPSSSAPQTPLLLLLIIVGMWLASDWLVAQGWLVG